MLVELAVRDLGVIAELWLVLGPGMTASPARPAPARRWWSRRSSCWSAAGPTRCWCAPGPSEARVEGRFVAPRATAASDRGRAGPGRAPLRAQPGLRRRPAGHRPASWPSWGERAGRPPRPARPPVAARPAAQRAALDRFGGVDLGAAAGGPATTSPAIDDALDRARRRRAGAGPRDRPAALPGRRARRRRGSTTPTRTTRLEAEEDGLADAAAHREAAAAALAALSADGEGAATWPRPRPTPGRRRRRSGRPGAVRRRRGPAARRWPPSWPTSPPSCGRPARRSTRTRSGSSASASAASCCATCAASTATPWPTSSPTADRAPRPGSPSWRTTTAGPPSSTPRGIAARKVEAAAAAVVAEARRAAAPGLAAASRPTWPSWPCPRPASRSRCRATTPATTSPFLLAANPGAPPLPLAKVASGGELARAMLALAAARGSTRRGHRTLVFDEVDAGIGGRAALAVGRSLAELADRPPGARRHPPAPGGGVRRRAGRGGQGRATATATASRRAVLDDDDRVVELSRMLSGQPDSDAADRADRGHARAELLAAARRRPGDREEAPTLPSAGLGRRGPVARRSAESAGAARPITGPSPAWPASTAAPRSWSSGSSPATSRSSTTRTSTGWRPRPWSTPVPVAVVNAAPSISGRYPNVGPLLLAAAGIPLLDDVGPEVMEAVDEGAAGRPSTATACLRRRPRSSPPAPARPSTSLEARYDERPAQHGRRARALRREHRRVHPRKERTCSPTSSTSPTSASTSTAAHVLIVVRGIDYREDLSLLQQPATSGDAAGARSASTAAPTPCSSSGYRARRDHRRLRLGVRAGAALRRRARRPRLPRRPGARAPSGSTTSGSTTRRSRGPGTSEDIAMLLAYEDGRRADRRRRHPHLDGRVPRQGPGRAWPRRSSCG